jgi:hypothetical protein
VLFLGGAETVVGISRAFSISSEARGAYCKTTPLAAAA